MSFLSLPAGCVYCIEDESRNILTVRYSVSLGQSLSRLYEDFGNRGYQLRVLSVTTDEIHLRLYCDYYRALYGVDKGSRRCLKYRVRKLVADDFKTVRVELVTARGGDGLVVGVFRSTAAAQDFIATYYASDNDMCYPVYAANSDTEEFLRRDQTKLQYIRI
jgi:hypothetical protein